MRETDYLNRMTHDVRVRVQHFIDKRRVVRFLVQLELEVEPDDWRPIIRYDTVHDFPHCDRYRLDRTVERHRPLNMDFNDALTYAIDDVTENWRKYRAAFLGEGSNEGL